MNRKKVYQEIPKKVLQLWRRSNFSPCLVQSILSFYSFFSFKKLIVATKKKILGSVFLNNAQTKLETKKLTLK